MVKTTPFSYISVTIWMHFLHTETSMTIVFVLSTIILPNPRNYNWEPDITFCHQFNDQNLQKLIEHVYLKFNVSSNFLRILETLQSQLCCSLLAFFFLYTHSTDTEESLPSLHSDGEEKLNVFSVQIFQQFAFIKLRVLLIKVTKHYGKNCGSNLEKEGGSKAKAASAAPLFPR